MGVVSYLSFHTNSLENREKNPQILWNRTEREERKKDGMRKETRGGEGKEEGKGRRGQRRRWEEARQDKGREDKTRQEEI